MVLATRATNGAVCHAVSLWVAAAEERPLCTLERGPLLEVEQVQGIPSGRWDFAFRAAEPRDSVSAAAGAANEQQDKG